ncbi:DUF4302 domain-containing protein [Ornithobacterium rhinotracheale]|uniref:DUF4302 domain-containing protein n=1 Tax=Ornithobacterium rhinotracheale TaxID=28251 RepID=UPI0040353844
MKIYKFTQIVSLAAVALLSGCGGLETEDLFDKPSSIRLEENRNEIQSALEANEEGWVLQYFPHPDRIYGGVNYFLTFKDGKVTAALEGDTQNEASAYQVLTRSGSVLSFSQYNSLLHQYATPSESKPEGDKGDFEFLVLRQNQDTIFLKGLRTGNYLNLIKIKKESPSLKSRIEVILNKLGEVDFPSAGKIGESPIVASSSSPKNLTLTYEQGKSPISFSYIYTAEGIQFYEPILVDGKEYSHLILDESSNTLKSEDGHIVIKLKVAPINFKTQGWVLDLSEETNRSNAFVGAIDADGLIHKIIFGDKYALQKYYVLGKLGQNVGFHTFAEDIQGPFAVNGLNFSADDNDPNLIHIGKGDAINFATYLLYVNSVLNKITNNSPYFVDKKDPAKPGMVKLTSQKDPSVWFYLDVLQSN